MKKDVLLETFNQLTAVAVLNSYAADKSGAIVSIVKKKLCLCVEVNWFSLCFEFFTFLSKMGFCTLIGFSHVFRERKRLRNSISIRG